MTQTSFYSRNYECWPPVHIRDIANPDSRHWQDQAQAEVDRLAELIGDEAYELQAPTWRKLFDLAHAEFEMHQAHPVECACVLPEQHCAACRNTANEIYPIEEQY